MFSSTISSFIFLLLYLISFFMFFFLLVSFLILSFIFLTIYNHIAFSSTSPVDLKLFPIVIAISLCCPCYRVCFFNYTCQFAIQVVYVVYYQYSTRRETCSWFLRQIRWQFLWNYEVVISFWEGICFSQTIIMPSQSTSNLLGACYVFNYTVSLINSERISFSFPTFGLL